MKNRRQQCSYLLSVVLVVCALGLFVLPASADEDSVSHEAMALQFRVSQHASKQLQQQLYRTLAQDGAHLKLDGIRERRIRDNYADLRYRRSMAEFDILAQGRSISGSVSRLRFAGR